MHGAKPILKSKGAKHITLGAALAVEIAVVRSTFRSQNAKSTRCSDHFWTLRCRKSARGCGAKLHCTTLYTTLHYITTFHHATLHYTTLLYTTLHYPTLHLQLQLRVQLHLQLRVQLQLQPRITRFQLHYTTPDDIALQLELQLQLHL